MNVGEILKNAPNAIVWAVTIAFIAVIGAFTVLSATGADTTDLRAFLNTILNIVGAIFSGGALVVAGAAAKSAGNAERGVNGDLDKRIEHGVRRAIVTPHGPGSGEPVDQPHD